MSSTYTFDQQSIIAQCTPRGSGALALVRLSGDDAFYVADNFCAPASGNNISDLPSHTIHYGTIKDHEGTVIDHVMFSIMHGPKTFTGQHTVEISCHNNQFIIEAIIEQSLAHGARLAQEGEFTKRAYLNKKIDLVQAEAINELIHANTQMALKKSLAQLEGSFSKWITTIEEDLFKALALSDASFEFIDEEMGFSNQILFVVNGITDTIRELKKTFNQQQQIRQGVRIALVGSVNAGKSSLFNALLNRNRAIVTPVAGTTRDALEAGLYRDGIYWTLIDTAGLRHTENEIEQEGINRSHQEAQAADIVVVVHDRSREMTAHEKTIYDELMSSYAYKTILVHNKSDLPAVLPNEPTAHISAATDKHSVALLEKEIEKKVAALFENSASPFLLNQRQFNLLLSLEKRLAAIKSMLYGPIDYELVSYELKDALVCLSELTGRSISEQGMDTVFKSFCVGK